MHQLPTVVFNRQTSHTTISYVTTELLQCFQIRPSNNSSKLNQKPRLPSNWRQTIHKGVFSYIRIYHFGPAILTLIHDTMTLIYLLDLDILKMYMHNKNEVYRSMFSTVATRTGKIDTHTHTHTHRQAHRQTDKHRQTDRQMQLNALHLHLRVVIMVWMQSQNKLN